VYTTSERGVSLECSCYAVTMETRCGRKMAAVNGNVPVGITESSVGIGVCTFVEQDNSGL
jgi:hypothetical protein